MSPDHAEELALIEVSRWQREEVERQHGEASWVGRDWGRSGVYALGLERGSRPFDGEMSGADDVRNLFLRLEVMRNVDTL